MEPPIARRIPGLRLWLSVLLIANVLAVYSNHFQDDFHFDDLTAINNNPAIRDPATIVRAFVDPALFSAAPEQRNYRPVTTASLALDYWLAGRLNAVFFHISTFIWFSVQLILMFLFFQWMMDLADRHPFNRWTALAAAAIFGFHPANAETVNYIIQRADLYNALGCVASLWLFARYPSQRRFGWYLIPAALAMLAKAPALIFPLLLLWYVLLFEREGMGRGRRWGAVIRSVLPALVVAGAAAALLAGMQPKTWTAGTVIPSLYRVTQPFVAMHYFATFFIPVGLSVDPRWPYLQPFSPQAMAGYFFVAALLGLAAVAWRRQSAKPVAFGILWFLTALLPTSLMPLADVTNDHRMFFPFVGLTLAVVWSLRLAYFRMTDRLMVRDAWVYSAIALSTVLAVESVATRVRNRVWLTEESLWGDATVKNPGNPRAWTNYGAAFFRQGDYQSALEKWDKAAILDPGCVICEENLVRVLRQLHRPELTEQHFQRVLGMHPPIPAPYIDFAEWLESERRFDESSRLLEQAARLYPHSQEFWRAHRKLFLQRDTAVRLPVFQILDTDRDTVLSAQEILAAPNALPTLDKNQDGKLSAEECGANLGDESRLTAAFLQKARIAFMQSNPVLRALDANHDGEISASEIRDSQGELATLDQNGDGQLETFETVPEDVISAVRRVMTMLDLNRDNRIEAAEWPGQNFGRLRSLLAAADIDGDGVVTPEELAAEIFYEADLQKHGVVTAEEMTEMSRSGAFGPISPPAAPPHRI